MLAAFRLPNGIFPKVTVFKPVPLDDATARKTQKTGFHAFEQLDEIAAKYAEHGVFWHHGKTVGVHHARLVQRKAEIGAVRVVFRFDAEGVAVPISVRFEFDFFLREHRFPFAQRNCYAVFVIVRTGIKRNLVPHALFQIYAVVCPILHARARRLRLHAHVMGILVEQRAVGLDFEQRVRARGIDFPSVTAVVFHRKTVLFAARVLCFKIAVFQHFGIKTAVERVIEVFEKQTDAALVYFDFFFLRKMHGQFLLFGHDVPPFNFLRSNARYM